MRYVVWAIRIIVFVLVLLFALNNTARVDVGFYNSYVISGVPLIVVMLLAFAAGALFALLVMVPSSLRRRRETSRLQKELDRINQAAQLARTQNAALSPDAVAPPSPL